MGENMRLHHRPRLDAMRAQMRSAPASLHVNYQELHSMHQVNENGRHSMHHANENLRHSMCQINENFTRTRRSIIGISKTSTLRPKLNALRAIRDASSRPYDWQDITMRKPSELPRADALRGSVNTRVALYSLPCNSQTVGQNQRTKSIPSKVDALRQQMASAPASRSGPGNLHSFCNDLLHKQEGCQRRLKLDENALRTIDQRLDMADYHRPAKSRSSTSCRDSSCNCDNEIRSRTHRRQSKGDATRSSLGPAPAGALNPRDVPEEFHPKNYRLRSDMDVLRRNQTSAPCSILCTSNSSNCHYQERGARNPKQSKKSVNFKDNMISCYDTQGEQDLQSKQSHGRRRETDGTGSHCTGKCEPSCNCEEIDAYKLLRTSEAGQKYRQSEERFREDPKVSSEDVDALSLELEASQVKCEHLDKSLQRQKMMLRLIRRNRERKCAVVDSTPQTRYPAASHLLVHNYGDMNSTYKWNNNRN